MKKLTWKLSVLIDVIKHPINVFFKQGKYNEGVDDLINQIIDNKVKLELLSYSVRYTNGKNSVQIWTGNFPYAYGYIYSINGERFDSRNANLLPLTSTMYRLQEYIAKRGWIQRESAEQAIETATKILKGGI